MIDTAHYVRYDRVTVVRETGRGLLGELHGELLAIDVVRNDVVRLRISRAGRWGHAVTEG